MIIYDISLVFDNNRAQQYRYRSVERYVGQYSVNDLCSQNGAAAGLKTKHK